MRKLYHLPVLSAIDLGFVRSPGPGLGNLLFPIARAIGGVESLGGEMVFPTMAQVKIGTLLRRERDGRFYSDIFRSRTAAEWKNWLAAKSVHAVDEGAPIDDAQTCVMRYKGLGDYFLPLAPHQAQVTRWITSNARLKGAITQPFDIGVHVRMADFIDDDGVETGFNVRQSWDWYAQAIDQARRDCGSATAQVTLFTDVDPQSALENLGLQSANVVLDPSGNAITAILNLSKARVLVTSRSTFSMWARFLGEGRAIWHHRMDVKRFMQVDPARDVVC